MFGNTMDRNLMGGISVDAGAIGNTVDGNAARGNGGDGISVISAGTVVRDNLARHNQGWGIYAEPGVIDGGRNGASGNTEPLQCHLIICSDGSDWVAPVRPPEPLDPLELGPPRHDAPSGRGARGRTRAGRGRRRARTAMIVVQAPRPRSEVERPESETGSRRCARPNTRRSGAADG